MASGTEGVMSAILDVEGEPFHLLSYSLQETLFEVPELSCEAYDHTRTTPDPATLIGKKAVLTLTRNDDATPRSFAGIVVMAERSTQQDDVRTLRLTVAPRLWRASKRADCRIFQEMSSVDIAKKVLTEAGVPDQQWQVTASYEPRTYTVQYRETDLDFVRRICSEEGISFYVKMEEGTDTVVFGDDPSGFGPIEGNSTLPFVQSDGVKSAKDAISHLEQTLQVRSDKVMLRDYDPDKPKVFVEGKSEGTDDGAHSLEVYVYPARTTKAAVAKRWADVLLESMQVERDVISGETNALALVPGHRFTVEDHPYGPLNQEYLILSVVHEGTENRLGAREARNVQRVFRCRFTAVPTSRSKYRPPRIERAQTLVGLQTAITTGPPGEEIYTEAGARVKAQFHWDRLGQKDDKSSCWMRTSQLTAGGAVLLPRMKWEVTVLCNEGDVDRPMVMGRVYNAVTPPPYALPGGKARASIQTATTPGGGSTNELRTDDTKGKEEMFFNASKDMTINVKNNATEKVVNNQTRKVGSNHKLEVTNSSTASVGANQTLDVGANQTIKVQTFAADEVGGSHSLSVGGNRSLKIGGDHKREVASSSTVEIGGNALNLVVGSVSESTLASHEHKVGAALIEMTASDKSVLVGGMRDESTGAAKIIVTKAGRALEVGGPMTQQVAGAIITKINGDRNDSSGATYTEIAAGAQVLKATNITFEADTMLSCVMGASTITLLPAMIAVAGVSVKLDGDAAETAAMILEN